MITRRTVGVGLSTLAAAASLAALTLAQSATGGFDGFWGPRYQPQPPNPAQPSNPSARSAPSESPRPQTARERLHHWNEVAIDASGLDHRPVAAGDPRVFGEQLGPARSSRAMAIVHIAIFEAVNAIAGEYRSLLRFPKAPAGTSMDAAIAQAAHDTLVAMFPSQRAAMDAELQREMAEMPTTGKAQGRLVGRLAAAAILARQGNDGSRHAEPRYGIEFIPSRAPGKWRQDPISRIPLALGAKWGQVKPIVLSSGSQFRVPPPPALASDAYARAFQEVKRVGGDGVTTPTARTGDETFAGIYWAYDGTPSLCAPPRMYNQIAMLIADQMGTTDPVELARLLALINVAMSDAGIAIWESKFYYQFWRPITGIREADRGTGPTGAGDGNAATGGDPTFTPLGAPASNLLGPDFTPPFPAYPSGHAGFGGALFEILRRFYRTDRIPFTFVSDEYNGVTTDDAGAIRPLIPRSFASLSRAEEENGQSRIYLGIHWSFDKTRGIEQGRRVARYVFDRLYTPR